MGTGACGPEMGLGGHRVTHVLMSLCPQRPQGAASGAAEPWLLPTV